MFCSKCGKTIPAGAETCPSCGKSVGDAHFAYSNNTSAQSIIVPGDDTYEKIPVNNYTRTTYTGMSEDAQRREAEDSHTTYRPLYEGASAARVRNDMRTAAEESRERVSRLDEEVDRENTRRSRATQRQIDRYNREDDTDVDSMLEDTEPAYEEADQAENAEAPVQEENPDQAEAPAAEAPDEDAPVNLEGLSEETLQKIDEVNASLQVEEDDLDMSQFKARPIEAHSRAGISEDVSEYIRQLEVGQTRKSRRKAAEPVEDIDDLEDVIPPVTPRKPFKAKAARRTAAPAEDIPEEDIPDTDVPDTDVSDTAAQEPAAEDIPLDTEAVDTDDNYDDLYEETGYDEGDYEDDRPSAVGTIIKVVIALVIVAALAFGVIRYVSYIRSNQSSAPIEGVTESVYNSAIEMIESHTTDEYKNSLISSYNTDGVLSVSNTLESDTAAIEALLPSDPSANDATFLEAVSKIQDNIGSAILMDAMSGDTSSEDSVSRWQVVTNSIAQLKSATSAAELTAIINGETITVHNETPEPTATAVVYTALQKGDENNDVLQLQVRLYTLGYLEGDRDGAYGSKTQTAVKLFQQTAGLSETGIADSETQALLYSDDAPYAPGATTPTPAPAATDTPAPTDAPAEATAAADDGTQTV